MKLGRLCLLTCTLIFTIRQNPALAADQAKASPILLELFTSEGCSSCPPVDAWVKKMDASQPMGATLVVLSEHVDYWNHDGWKDPYSSPLLTERQSAYSRALGLKEVYTPQVIIDGASEVRLSDPQQTASIFAKAAATSTVPVHIASVAVEGDNPPILRARVEVEPGTEERDVDVYFAVALDHAESQVLHGENSGKRLTHVAVVESLKKIAKLERGKSLSKDVQIKLKPGTDPANLRVVAFLQESGPGRVYGVALLKPPFK